MVLDEGIGLDPIPEPIPEPINTQLITKKEKVRSIIDRDERTILGEERRLIGQEKQFLKQTKRQSLTLNRQFNLAASFGLGGVQFEAKRIAESKRRARRITNPKFLRAKGEIVKSKKNIKERRAGIDFINENTIVQDFGIDLSRFRVDTLFNF